MSVSEFARTRASKKAAWLLTAPALSLAPPPMLLLPLLLLLAPSPLPLGGQSPATLPACDWGKSLTARGVEGADANSSSFGSGQAAAPGRGIARPGFLAEA